MVQGPSDLWAIEVAGGTIISYNFSLKKYLLLWRQALSYGQLGLFYFSAALEMTRAMRTLSYLS